MASRAVALMARISRSPMSYRYIPVILGLASLALLAVQSTEPRLAVAADKAPSGKAQHYGAQVDTINQLIRKGWADKELTPSPAATDSEWCRRLYLDVLGRIPTVEELNKFLSDNAASKRADLVDILLNSDEYEVADKAMGTKHTFNYVKEYADNWSTLWTTTLIGRPKGNREEERSLVNREGMQEYLRRSFQKNRKWDQMVYELVSAKGNTTPGHDDYNGAVNFLIGNMEENGLQATAKTAQIFMGLQVQCTQCHNHPFNEWKQNQFWEFNAFFRQTYTMKHAADGNKRKVESAELSNHDFAGENGQAELYYELRNGKLQAAYPVFVDGRPLNELVQKEVTGTGALSQVDRRTELAKLIVSSDYMNKAIVNRMWAHFMGYGFTKPIDDMGPHNVPTNQELLTYLAKEFATNSHDLKQLIRWIVLSDPYALSARFTPKNKMDDPAIGEKPMFSHFYLRQMRAEELYESLMVATEADEATKGSDEMRQKVKDDWLKQFTIAFGTDEGDDTTTFNGTIPQILMMFNGDLVKKATSIDKGGFLEKIETNSKMKQSDKFNYLYMAALGRKPTGAESEIAEKVYAARKGNMASTLQDVWWSLLNSNEFILNH